MLPQATKEHCGGANRKSWDWDWEEKNQKGEGERERERDKREKQGEGKKGEDGGKQIHPG